jgi:acetyl esterase/lipase
MFTAAAAIGTGLPVAAKRSDPLAFDPDAYTMKTATIDGKKVTYRFYRAVTYVAKPVDAAYQSLTVSVPLAIDDVAIYPFEAPILFANSVGGYLPSTVAGASEVGGPPFMPGMPFNPGGPMLPVGLPVSNSRLALAAGYVVVEPGARGRTLVDAGGRYYGTAPAAIVDLKAAVRFVRFNAGRIPGDTDRIVSTGVSAGGALSALLGASGDNPRYDSYLAKLGAADASDAVFAAAAYCPITDLEHADAAYEWCWGANPLVSGEPVDQRVSQQLAAAFTGYPGVPAEDYREYLLDTYLRPASGRPGLTWAKYAAHVGARRKTVPAFDAFDLSSGENSEFGAGTIAARHFTRFSLRHATGNPHARLDDDIAAKLTLMNPMYFLERREPGRARHWWLRTGTRDTDTSLTVLANLALAARNAGGDVNARMYWDAGHGANEDPDAFLAWIAGLR